MTREEAKSCIGTIEMLQRLAYNIHGVMDVVDADNCKNIIKALEKEPCEDWYDVPSDKLTLEQARQAVKDLRKKLAEYLEKNRENLINQRANTCRHGGHCEWVACDKCNHYEPDVLNQQPCEDAVSRDCDKCAYYDDGANHEACDECFADEYEHPNFKPRAQHCEDCISRQAVLALPTSKTKTLNGEIVEEEVDIELIKALPSVTPKEKTGKWINDEFGSKCSCCGIHTHLDKFDRPMKFKYCSMCGAKMIEPTGK